MLYTKGRQFLNFTKPLVAFFFDHTGAKKKACKKETPRIISPSAEGEEGSAPSTARAFEKARPKLSIT